MQDLDSLEVPSGVKIISREAKRSRIRRAFRKIFMNAPLHTSYEQQGSKSLVLWRSHGNEVIIIPEFEGNKLRFLVEVLSAEGVPKVSPVLFNTADDVIIATKAYL